MRCVACGAEMLLIRAEPDQSMLLSGQELRTFECPNCQRTEQTLVFTRSIEEIPGERMLLPSRSSWGPDIRHTLLKAAQRSWGQAVAGSRKVIAALTFRLNP
jgi:DNA-directed RNA polymerase subunit RPC12/RpoP